MLASMTTEDQAADQDALARSPEMMSPDDTALLVIDVQQRLIPHINGHAQIVWNIGRLIDGATILGVEVRGTEQYPKGLGPTVESLARRLGELPEKLTFSCAGCPEIFRDLRRREIHRLVVTGIEAHVCVQQTVLDLLAGGFQVCVAADAIGSRRPVDYRFALRRLEAAGTILTTTEAILMEWCQIAGTPQFKQISQLVRQLGPDDAATAPGEEGNE
jgi:nicotinamidase-related amidase